MDVIVNVEFGGKLRESPECRLLLWFICSIWCLTQYPARGRKKNPTHVWAEEKPCILSVLKFDSEVLDPGRQKANGGGGKAGRQETDGPFLWAQTHQITSDWSKSVCHLLIEREATAQWSQIKSAWCVKSEPLHEPLNGDIRFQSFLLCSFCAHRFNAHATPASFALSPNVPLPAAQTLRESCCAGFYPAEAQACTSHSLRVSGLSLVSLHLHGRRADIIALYTW